MTGIRGAGALTALQEMGLGKAFDSIYGTSAGFANCCFFLASDMRIGTSIYYEELCTKNFINLKRVWDIVDVDYVLKVMKDIKKLPYDKLSNNPTKLYARLFNLISRSTEYKLINGLPAEEIESVMHAAISLPYLDPGSVDIQNIQYKDANSAEKELEFRALAEEIQKSDSTDILIIYNYPEQYEYMRNAGIFDSENLYQIVPYSENKISRVSNDPKKLIKAAEEMGTLVNGIFGVDEPLIIK